MKVFDCFTFFNELDLLEIRLRLLAPYVDHFVIAESNITHSGNPKPYNFEAHKERYEAWKDKIIYLQIQQSPEGLIFNANQQQHDINNGSWKLENQHRMGLCKAGAMMQDDDMVLISDLDEIPDPAVFTGLQVPVSPVVLSLLFHNYFMNLQNVKVDRWWNGTILCSGKYFNIHGPQELRDKRNEYPKIKKAGWHFSYLGGVERIRQKLLSFAHVEYNKQEYLDENHILHSLEKGRDVLKRKNVRYRFASLSRYPAALRNLMQQYPQFIRELPWHKRLLNFFR